MKPRPPASLTAAASSGVDGPPAIGAWTIGSWSSARMLMVRSPIAGSTRGGVRGVVGVRGQRGEGGRHPHVQRQRLQQPGNLVLALRAVEAEHAPLVRLQRRPPHSEQMAAAYQLAGANGLAGLAFV